MHSFLLTAPVKVIKLWNNCTGFTAFMDIICIILPQKGYKENGYPGVTFLYLAGIKLV